MIKTQWNRILKELRYFFSCSFRAWCHLWPFRDSTASLHVSLTETLCLTPPATKTLDHPELVKGPPHCHESLNGGAPSERGARAKVRPHLIILKCHLHIDLKMTPCRCTFDNNTFQIVSTASGSSRPPRRFSVAPPHRVSDCLRHGNSSDARAVRAVCLLMGGAAASSALGYLNSCSPTSPLASRSPEIAHGAGGFPDNAAGAFHACSQDVDSPHFNSFDFEGDSDFDAFDCGGFAF